MGLRKEKRLEGQIGTKILETENGVVVLCNDTVTNLYSIGIVTSGGHGIDFKVITKGLYQLLIKELT